MTEIDSIAKLLDSRVLFFLFHLKASSSYRLIVWFRTVHNTRFIIWTLIFSYFYFHWTPFCGNMHNVWTAAPSSACRALDLFVCMCVRVYVKGVNLWANSLVCVFNQNYSKKYLATNESITSFNLSNRTKKTYNSFWSSCLRIIVCLSQN